MRASVLPISMVAFGYRGLHYEFNALVRPFASAHWARTVAMHPIPSPATLRCQHSRRGKATDRSGRRPNRLEPTRTGRSDLARRGGRPSMLLARLEFPGLFCPGLSFFAFSQFADILVKVSSVATILWFQGKASDMD